MIIIILGILFFPLINGGVYYFITKDIVVIENPTYEKKDDEFQLYSIVRSLTEYELEELPVQEGYDAEEFEVTILNSKDKGARVKIHMPKAMIENRIIRERLTEYDEKPKTDETIRDYTSQSHVSYCKRKKDDLSEEQKIVYEKYNDVAYCQVYVDKNIYYAKISEDDYKFISKKEFEENAYNFNKDTDFIRLIKRSIRLPHEIIFFLLVLIMSLFQFFYGVKETKLYIFFLGVYVGCLVLDAFFYNYILGSIVTILSTVFIIYGHKHQYKFGKGRFIMGAACLLYAIYYCYYKIVTGGF